MLAELPVALKHAPVAHARHTDWDAALVKKPAEQGDWEPAPAAHAKPGLHVEHAAPALPVEKEPAAQTVG